MDYSREQTILKNEWHFGAKLPPPNQRSLAIHIKTFPKREKVLLQTIKRKPTPFQIFSVIFKTITLL